MPLQVAADEVEDTHGLLAGADLAADRRASTVRRLAGGVARRDPGTERHITDLEQALEGLRQRLEVDGPGRPDVVHHRRLDRQNALAGLEKRGRDRPIAGEGRSDLSVDLAQRFRGAQAGRLRWGQPSKRDLHVASLKLPMLA